MPLHEVSRAEIVPTSLGFLGWMLAPPNAATRLVPFTYTATAPDGSYPDYDNHYAVSTTSVTAFTQPSIGKLNDGLIAGTMGGVASDLNFALGYQAGNPVFTLDLGLPQQILEVRLYGILNTGAAVNRPSAILLERSDDNTTFTTVENRTGLTNGSGNGVWEARVDASGQAPHRWWRLTATRVATWIHVSEARVLA